MDGVVRDGGAAPVKSPITIAVAALLLALLTLAALETWTEHAARQGRQKVAAGVERGSPGVLPAVEGLLPGVEASPIP